MNDAEAAAPSHIREWADQRARHRRSGSYASADVLRDRIEQAGWMVTDTPTGPVLARKPAYATIEASAVPDHRQDPDTVDCSVLVLLESHGLRPAPEWVRSDAQRAVSSVLASATPHLSFEVVIVDDGVGGQAGAWAADMARNPGVMAYHLAEPAGFVRARALQHRAARGRVLLWLDTGVELTGDALGRMVDVLEDPTVGAVGRWGADLSTVHEFRAVDPGPVPVDVHAVWGYMMAMPRRLFATGAVGLDEGFGFYRNVDADISLALRAQGLRCVVVDLPAVQHVHRGYSETPHDVLQRESRRSYRRLLRRWRPQMEELARGTPPGTP